MASELVSLTPQTLGCDDPRFCVCYAQGAVFKPEGDFYRVEKGSRRVVHRSLCLTHYYKARCTICPNGAITVQLKVQEVDPHERR